MAHPYSWNHRQDDYGRNRYMLCRSTYDIVQIDLYRQSRSETKRMNNILLERNRQEDQETPSIPSLTPRSLKKKDDEFSSSPIPIEKGRMKKIDTASIQKLKLIMNHPIKKQQQLQQKSPMESSSTTASTSSDTKPCENSISSQGSTFYTNNHPISRALSTAQVQSMLAIF